MPAPDAEPTPDSPETTPEQTSQTRPGTQPSAPSASQYMPELPYAEELQALLEGKYIVESFLGQGGMGAVYRGLQLPLKRPVAIKILAKGQAGAEDDYAFEERFKREAYAMAALTHPNIVQVYDCGDAGENFLFISMELVEGGDLSDAIKGKLVTPEVALAMIGPICDGLQTAHEHGLVHRDIKPANIFLTADGKPKVADFGLAKKFDSKATMVTKTGLGMGTPDYAAPEQYEGVADIDHRADVYALGVMFYQMLTGGLPRGAYKPVSQRVPVDPRLDDVVTKAMESDRAERYQSVALMKADVEQIIATWMARPQAAPAAPPTGTIPTRTSAIPVHTGRVPVGHRTGAHAPVHTAGVPTHRPTGHTAAVPPPAKSRAGMLIGVFGAVAVIAGGAFFLTQKPKPVANGPVVPPAAVSSAAPSTYVEDTSNSATPPGANTPSVVPPSSMSPRADGFSSFAPNAAWRSGLEVPEKWGGNWERVGAEMHVGEGKTGRFFSSDESVNSGVRVRFRAPQAGGYFDLVLRLNKGDVGPRYVTSIRPAATALGSIDLLPPAEKGPRLPIMRFESNPDVSPEVEHTAEFYAVGDQLTFFFDGRQFATARDGMLLAGHSGITASQGMEVISVETATLEGMAPPPPAPAGDVLTFGGHRYQLNHEKVIWMDAKRRAEAAGGHLATITSAEESAWIQETFVKGLPNGPGLWIGGESQGTPGEWRWVTGEPFEYTAWMPGEPQNQVHEPALMFMRKNPNMGWADMNAMGITVADRRMGFIIEWDGDAPPMPVIPAADGTVNLLALADVKRDAVRGEWVKTPEGLSAIKTTGPQLLAFNYAPPEEYDFEIEFTMGPGLREVTQVLALPGRSISWKMGVGGGPETPFCFGPFLDGKSVNQEPTRTEANRVTPRFNVGQRYRSLVEVRKGSLRALLNGEEWVQWSGDLNRFANEDPLIPPNPANVAVATWSSGLVVHKAEIRVPASARIADTQAPAPAPAATPESGSWRPVFTDDMKKNPKVTVLPDGWIRVEKAYLNAPPAKDVAMRARVRFHGGGYVWPFRLRDTPTRGLMHYAVNVTSAGEIKLHRRAIDANGMTADDKPLKDHKAARSLGDGAEFDLEVSAQGDRLTLKLDGSTVIDVQDTLHQGTVTKFGGDTAIIEFKDLEWRDLTPAVAAGPAPSTPGGGERVDRSALIAADPRLKKLEDGFKTRYESDAQKPFAAAVAKLNKSYLSSGVAKARADAQTKGSAAEVAALDEVKARIERGEGVPDVDEPGVPESLKALRAIYRNAMAKLVAERDARAAPLYDLYLGALDAYIVELTRENKIAEAKQVKALREDVAAQKPKIELAPTPAVAAVTPPAPPVAPAVTAPKSPASGVSSWRAAANYLVSSGSTFVAVKSGVVTQVSKEEHIPAGKFDIREISFDRWGSVLPQPTDEEFQALHGLRDLVRVWVRTPEARLSDAAFAFLAGNDELLYVNLEGVPAVTDAVLEHLGGARKLQFLGVQYAPGFTGKGLEKMPFLENLTGADFLASGMTDEGVKTLSACKQLQSVRISGGTATDAAFATLGGLKNLNNLDVSNTAFGDAAAAAFAGHRNLITIQAANTPLTDEGLGKLEGIKSLTTLVLNGSKVSAVAAEAFQKAMPQCKVTR